LDNAGSFARFIGHGRRFELDYAVDQLRRNPGYKANRNVKFTADGRSYVSDIDGSLGGVAFSLKRQGKTVDSWVSGKSDEFLAKWFIAVGKKADGNKIEFIIGGGKVSEHTKARLDEIMAKLDNRYSYEIKHHPLKQPPPIPAYEP
jgi:hypothetical protein